MRTQNAEDSNQYVIFPGNVRSLISYLIDWGTAIKTLDSCHCADIQQEIQMTGKSVGLGDVLRVSDSILSSKLSFNTFRFFKKNVFIFCQPKR